MTRATEPSELATFGLPAGVESRPLTTADLGAAQLLSQEAGWNQTAEDWRVFLELGQATGLFACGRLVASAATLPYDGRFAWISMVLVTEEQRRRGLARWLLGDCIARLEVQGMFAALDATPAGRMVYRTLGFTDTWSLHRLIARRSAPAFTAPSAGVIVRPLKEADWPALDEFDATVFGARRAELLHRLAARLPAAALVAERNGALAGYLLGRDGRAMSQLGPLAATDEAVARALLAQAMAGAAAPFVIDVPDRHGPLGDWLISLGFAVERPYTRMVLGCDRAFDDEARLFAIAGPELG